MSSESKQREFERLYRQHQPAVLREAMRLAGNEAEAWDLTQDTFERAYRSFESYRPVGSVFGWLRTIMSRLFIDAWRRQRRLTELDEAGLPEAGVEEPPLWRTFSDEELRLAIAELPQDKRILIEAHVFEQQSYVSLATRMRLRVTTVGTRLHRIRGGLRLALLRRRQATPTGRGRSAEPGVATRPAC